MDVEALNLFKNRVSNLSDASPAAEWQGIARMFGDLYKAEVAEVLTGATTPTLATERSDAETDIAALVAEMTTDTSQ